MDRDAIKGRIAAALKGLLAAEEELLALALELVEDNDGK